MIIKFGLGVETSMGKQLISGSVMKIIISENINDMEPGDVYIDTKLLTINIYVKKFYFYEVDFESKDLVKWLEHLKGKNWYTQSIGTKVENAWILLQGLTHK